VADLDGSESRSGTGDLSENILVVQTSFIGDAVLVQPLVSTLREHFPGCTLTVLCAPAVAELLRASLQVNHVLTYDKRGDARGIGGLYRFARTLAGNSYSMAISAHKSLRTALLLWLARIPLRIGFRQSAGWFLYHRRVRRDPKRHEVLRNLSLLGALGIELEEVQPDLKLAVALPQHNAVADKLESLGVTGELGRVRFGINPGSVWPTKRWSIAGYAALVVALKAKYVCDVLIFGGPDDVPTAEAIQKESGGSAIDLTTQFTLAELPAALERCDVLISNDSAPMHMAVARGVPVVAVFCATTPGLGFYPFSGRSVVVQKNLHCRPCGSHGGRRCPLGTYGCIEGVGVASVLHAVHRVLERPMDAGRYSYTPEFVTV